MKDKEYHVIHVANFGTFVSKTLIPPPPPPPPKKKWMNLTSNQLTTTSIKFGRFQNGCNKVVIELRVVQIWSAIILVISN